MRRGGALLADASVMAALFPRAFRPGVAPPSLRAVVDTSDADRPYVNRRRHAARRDADEAVVYLDPVQFRGEFARAAFHGGTDAAHNLLLRWFRRNAADWPSPEYLHFTALPTVALAHCAVHDNRLLVTLLKHLFERGDADPAMRGYCAGLREFLPLLVAAALEIGRAHV